MRRRVYFTFLPIGCGCLEFIYMRRVNDKWHVTLYYEYLYKLRSATSVRVSRAYISYNTLFTPARCLKFYHHLVCSVYCQHVARSPLWAWTSQGQAKDAPGAVHCALCSVHLQDSAQKTHHQPAALHRLPAIAADAARQNKMRLDKCLFRFGEAKSRGAPVFNDGTVTDVDEGDFETHCCKILLEVSACLHRSVAPVRNANLERFKC